MQFKYCTIDDYGQEEMFLEERLKVSRTISGTQKLHCFIPLSNTKILTKSFSSIAKEERVVHLHKIEIPIDEINGFVTAMHGDNWCLGCVLQVNQEDKTVRITTLIPNGPSQSYKYSVRERVISVSADDILTKVDPSISYGRTYTISKKDTKAAKEQLKYKLKALN